MSTLNGTNDFELLKQKLDNDGFLGQFNDSDPKMSKILAFSIDPFNTYYQNIDLKDKRILTVLSSGDQWLDALSRGTKKSDIVTYDINKLSIYYTYMKLLSISLRKKNVFHYSEYDNLKTFFPSEKEYENNRLRLPLEIKKFWDLFYNANFYQKLSFSDFMVDLPWHSAEYLKSPKAYEHLHNALVEEIPEIPFHNCCLTALGENLQSSFDVINISNVLDFLPITSELFLMLRSLLENNGVIVGDVFSFTGKFEEILNVAENTGFSAIGKDIKQSWRHCKVLQLYKK